MNIFKNDSDCTRKEFHDKGNASIWWRSHDPRRIRKSMHYEKNEELVRRLNETLESFKIQKGVTLERSPCIRNFNYHKRATSERSHLSESSTIRKEAHKKGVYQGIISRISLYKLDWFEHNDKDPFKEYHSTNSLGFTKFYRLFVNHQNYVK